MVYMQGARQKNRLDEEVLENIVNISGSRIREPNAHCLGNVSVKAVYLLHSHFLIRGISSWKGEKDESIAKLQSQKSSLWRTHGFRFDNL